MPRSSQSTRDKRDFTRKINGSTYRFIHVEDVATEIRQRYGSKFPNVSYGKYDGVVVYSERKVFIRASLRGEKLRQAYIHEMMHICLPELPERHIKKMEERLYPCLKVLFTKDESSSCKTPR